MKIEITEIELATIRVALRELQMQDMKREGINGRVEACSDLVTRLYPLHSATLEGPTWDEAEGER